MRRHPRFPFRVDNGRSREREVSPQPPLPREVLCAIPLSFLEEICCLGWITEESCDSGHNPSLEVMAKRWETQSSSRTILGRDVRRVPESISGLVSGESDEFFLEGFAPFFGRAK